MSEPPEQKRYVNGKATMSSFSDYAMNEFISQRISEFTRCEMEDVLAINPGHKHWLTGFILNSVFIRRLSKERLPFAYMFLRHADFAMVEYNLARTELSKFLESDHRKFSSYFRGLSHLESAISRVCQAYELARRLLIKEADKNFKLYDGNGNSSLKRLYDVYNVIKHGELDSVQPDQIQIVWLSNDGVHVSKKAGVVVVAYSEMAEMFNEIASIAEQISAMERKESPASSQTAPASPQ